MIQSHGILPNMNNAQTEIHDLQTQVSQLYVIIKKLSEYVGLPEISHLNFPLESPSIMKLSQSSHQNGGNYGNDLKESHKGGDNIYLLNQHKDILVDDESVHSSTVEKNQHSDIISCEEQVHRLTAQLTAAYYRIASLEEQLLAIRNNMEMGDNGFYQCQ